MSIKALEIGLFHAVFQGRGVFVDAFHLEFVLIGFGQFFVKFAQPVVLDGHLGEVLDGQEPIG